MTDKIKTGLQYKGLCLYTQFLQVDCFNPAIKDSFRHRMERCLEVCKKVSFLQRIQKSITICLITKD